MTREPVPQNEQCMGQIATNTGESRHAIFERLLRVADSTDQRNSLAKSLCWCFVVGILDRLLCEVITDLPDKDGVEKCAPEGLGSLVSLAVNAAIRTVLPLSSRNSRRPHNVGLR